MAGNVFDSPLVVHESNVESVLRDLAHEYISTATKRVLERLGQ